MQNLNCFICKNMAKSQERGGTCNFQCPRCGNFKIDPDTLDDINSSPTTYIEESATKKSVSGIVNL